MNSEPTAYAVNPTDGTRLAVDVVGGGPPLVLVGGAFSFRRYKGFIELAEALSDAFTVISYDRRGRGQSESGSETTVQAEIEDLRAVVGQLDGPAHIFGMSSGGVLTLRAVADGVAARSVTVYQPPFVVNTTGKMPPRDFGEHLADLVRGGRRSAAVHYFMTRGMGAPPAVVVLMRLAPFWKDLKAVAHTLPADHAVMGDTLGGKALASLPWSRVESPTLILDGSKSGATSAAAADELHRHLPRARRRTLEGQGHNVSMTALATEIRQFASLAESTAPRRPTTGTAD